MWSSDVSDPEARGLSTSCGRSQDRSCLTGGTPQSAAILYFAQGALVGEPIPISSTAPIKFHFDLEVRAAPGYTVQLVMQKGTTLTKSDVATEVSPGVFEGLLTTGRSLDPATFTYFGVWVNTGDPLTQIIVRTGGASWLQLSAPGNIRSTSELLAADTYRPDPATLRTAERSFGFNDRDYDLTPFTARLGGTTTVVDLPTERDTAFVMVWVEGVATLTAYDVVRGSESVNSPNDATFVSLARNGQVMGGGRDNHVEMSVPAGLIKITARSTLSASDAPVKGYILRVYGERTLSWMHWLFNSTQAHRSPISAQCPNGEQQIPSTPALVSFALDLSWRTVSPTPESWAWSYDTPTVGSAPCAEAGDDTHLRFTFPGKRVWRVGATPGRASNFVSATDVLFDGEVRFTYAP